MPFVRFFLLFAYKEKTRKNSSFAHNLKTAVFLLFCEKAFPPKIHASDRPKYPKGALWGKAAHPESMGYLSKT